MNTLAQAWASASGNSCGAGARSIPLLANAPVSHVSSDAGQSQKRTMLTVVLYALAMAWVESAVVFYLRTMIDRIVPYQPNPLPFAAGFGFAEIVREAATMIMLFTVGWLAGRTWRSRFGYALLAFGVWDIAYYIWLVPLTGWPRSFTDWDILFLIPLPWWGPVWAPVSIAALMIIFGATVARHDTPARPIWPGRKSVVVALLGGTIALYVFMADALELIVVGGGAEQLRDLLPKQFNWPLFLVALVLLAVPVAQVMRRVTSAQKKS